MKQGSRRLSIIKALILVKTSSFIFHLLITRYYMYFFILFSFSNASIKLNFSSLNGLITKGLVDNEMDLNEIYKSSSEIKSLPLFKACTVDSSISFFI